MHLCSPSPLRFGNAISYTILNTENQDGNLNINMSDRTLQIGECKINGEYYPVYARASDDLIITYPTSHHFNNLPLKLVDDAKDKNKKGKKPKNNKKKKDDDDEEGQYV